MKLDPIAKPIRIRIKLGKNEYSTIDEVKNNFSVKELFPLYLDGRLSRWLRQRNENMLADKVDGLREAHHNETVEDYVYFISIFFPKIENTLKLCDSPKNILSVFIEQQQHLEQLSQIYQCTKSVESINWTEILTRRLTPTNFKSYFEDVNLHNILRNGDKGWGTALAEITKTETEYKEIFSYLEPSVQKHPEYREILEDYYSITRKKGFEWFNIFNPQSIAELMHWYSSRSFRLCCCGAIPDWGTAFSSFVKNENDFTVIFSFFDECMQNNPTLSDDFKQFILSTGTMHYNWYEILRDKLELDDLIRYHSAFPDMPDWDCYFADKTSIWELDSKKVGLVLQGDSEGLDSYYQKCVEKGFSEAIDMVNPWMVVANSKECKLLISILQNWENNSWIDQVDQQKSECPIQSDLGKQILEFVRELRGLLTKTKNKNVIQITDNFLKRTLEDVHTQYEKARLPDADMSNHAYLVNTMATLLYPDSINKAARTSVQLVIGKLQENRK